MYIYIYILCLLLLRYNKKRTKIKEKIPSQVLSLFITVEHATFVEH